MRRGTENACTHFRAPWTSSGPSREKGLSMSAPTLPRIVWSGWAAWFRLCWLHCLGEQQHSAWPWAPEALLSTSMVLSTGAGDGECWNQGIAPRLLSCGSRAVQGVQLEPVFPDVLIREHLYESCETWTLPVWACQRWTQNGDKNWLYIRDWSFGPGRQYLFT